MRRFLLDTGITALHLDRKRGVFERAAVEVARENRVGIAAPVLAEIAFRAEGSPQRDRNVLRLRQALDVWKLWLVDTAAALEYGRPAFELKTIGRPMGQNEIMIAAVALSLGNTTVVTIDADLSFDHAVGPQFTETLRLAQQFPLSFSSPKPAKAAGPIDPADQADSSPSSGNVTARATLRIQSRNLAILPDERIARRHQARRLPSVPPRGDEMLCG